MDLLELTLNIAKKVGDYLRRSIPSPESISIVSKSRDDVTRKIDLDIENMIIEELKSRDIDCIVVCEEHGIVKIGNTNPKYIFVVDPLDGSANFVSNLPFYSISIASGLYKGQNMLIRDLEVGVVNYVPREVMYISDSNSNMFKIEGDDIMYTEYPHEKPSFVLYTEPKNRELMLKFLDEFWREFPEVKVRIFGAASIEMMQTLLGKFLGFIDVRDKLRVVDISASYVCAKVLNAHVLDLRGRDIGDRKILELPRLSFILSRDYETTRRLLKIFDRVLRNF